MMHFELEEMVRDLQTKLDLAGEVNKSLEIQLADKTKVTAAQHEFIKRLEAPKKLNMRDASDLEAENAALNQQVTQLRALLTKMGLDLWLFASMVARTKKSDAWGNCVDEANKILKTEKKA